MPWAFLNPDGTIKQVVPKPSPFMRIGEGERLVRYDWPQYDPRTHDVAPVVPVPEGAEAVTWTVTPRQQAEVYETFAAQVRSQRDKLLAECDWTQGRDISAQVADAWAPYRQALRDIPQQAGFPLDVIWPAKP